MSPNATNEKGRRSAIIQSGITSNLKNGDDTPISHHHSNFYRKKNIIDRLKFGEFVKENVFLEDEKRSAEKRSHILFTDETWLEVSPQGNRQSQRYYTEDPT